MSGLATFRISADAVGNTKVEINGQDLSGLVSGVTYQGRPGEVPVVSLMVRSADTEIAGDGIVRVASDQGDESDDREILRGFLNSIDPNWLDQEVLKRAGWGSSKTMPLVLEVLKERVG